MTSPALSLWFGPRHLEAPVFTPAPPPSPDPIPRAVHPLASLNLLNSLRLGSRPPRHNVVIHLDQRGMIIS